jgi:pimeloyl-ACP methyl ester carboxylesterase
LGEFSFLGRCTAGIRNSHQSVHPRHGFTTALKISWHLRGGLGPVFLILAFISGPSAKNPQVGQRLQPLPATPIECVVLLHGLGRTRWSMKPMADALRAAGYVTVNIDYPSRKQPIEILANSAVGEGIESCRQADAAAIHFVTHSMGGILVRYFLAKHRLDRLGRVVMLSPPNQGSEVTDMLKNEPLYAWINGPAGQQLGTDPDSLPLRLGRVNFALGVITGNRAAFYDTWLADAIPGPNDGKVSVARAQVAGMADFLVVPSTHTFIMEEPQVILQTFNFLRYGHFQPDNAPAAKPRR